MRTAGGKVQTHRDLSLTLLNGLRAKISLQWRQEGGINLYQSAVIKVAPRRPWKRKWGVSLSK